MESDDSHNFYRLFGEDLEQSVSDDDSDKGSVVTVIESKSKEINIESSPLAISLS